MMATIAIAEKGPESTSHIRPAQQHYRSDADWAMYRNNIARMKQSQRPHFVRTRHAISFDDVRAGHSFMANDFSARDPMTEIVARENQKLVAAEPAPAELPSNKSSVAWLAPLRIPRDAIWKPA
jgi:hypothetical protein